MSKNLSAAVLNFLVWSLGYAYKGKLGFVWIVAYIFAHIPIFYFGWNFYFIEITGMSILTAHTIISILLAYDVYK